MQVRVLLRVFFFLTIKCCFGQWAVEDFTTFGTLDQKILPSLRTFTYEAQQTLDHPDDGVAMAQAPGCQRSSSRSVRRGRGGDRYNQQRT